MVFVYGELQTQQYSQTYALACYSKVYKRWRGGEQQKKRREERMRRGREKEDCNIKMHIQAKEDEKYQELLRGVEIIRVG